MRKSFLLAMTFIAVAFSQVSVATTTIKGVLKQGGLLVGKTVKGSTVYLDERKLQVSDDGHFAFGFGRDETNTVTLTITKPDGKKEVRQLKPEIREYNIQRIKGIAQKIMNPDEKAIARAREDNKQIAKARSNRFETTDFTQGFVAPSKGQITGVYGSQRVYNGVPKRPHFGLDYAGPVGAPVYAPAAGKVTLWVPDMFYSGGTMIIDHGHGVSSTFLHLSASHVKVGDYVKQGQLVADIGKSGRVTGPHLDWRINWFDKRLDPALALKILP